MTNSSSYPRYFANEASVNADSDATRRLIETYAGARVRSSPPITHQISASQLILRLRLLQGRSVMHTTALCNLGRRSVPSRPPRLVARPPRLVSVRYRHVYEPKQKAIVNQSNISNFLKQLFLLDNDQIIFLSANVSAPSTIFPYHLNLAFTRKRQLL